MRVLKAGGRNASFLVALAASLPGLLLFTCGGNDAGRETAKPAAPAPPIILISIDTLRADRLPAYGYDSVATPHIDRLRADSILFENAYSHSPLTLPSHLSVLTGRLPFEHGVRNNIGYRFDAERHPTLAVLLGGQGYRTAAAVSAYVLRGETGISHGFDFYEDGIAGRDRAPLGALQRPGRIAVETALRWIGQQPGDSFFFLLHLFEPHSPYEPPEPFRSRYAHPYDGEIAAADAALGTFLDGLVDLGVYDRAAIFFFSDHGEGLSDHGEDEHGIFLYREAIQVPLILKLPAARAAGTSVSPPVGLVDLLPSIAELAGFDPPTGSPGASLLPTASGDRPGERLIYSETLYPRIHLGWSELRSLVGSRFHLIQAPRPELYDMLADARERNDVARREPRVFRSMRDRLADLGETVELPSDVDPQELERLAALGYLGSLDGASASGPLPDPKDRIGEIAQLREAFLLESQSRYGEAIAILRRLVERNPGFMDAWNKLALTLDAAGRWGEAIDAYRQALSQTPTLAADYALSLSSIHLKLGQFEEALAHAELALTHHPAKARILLGRIALEQGKLTAAEEHVRRAMASPTERFTAAVLLVRILTAQGRLDEATALTARTREEAAGGTGGPVQGLAFVDGDLRARRGDNRAAEEAFREEIHDFPRDRQTYANLALLLMTEGRAEEARAALETLGERNPSRQTFLFIAHTLDTLGDRKTASEWRRRADALAGRESATPPRPTGASSPEAPR